MGLRQRISKMEEKLDRLEKINMLAAKLSAKNDEIIRELVKRVKALEGGEDDGK